MRRYVVFLVCMLIAVAARADEPAHWQFNLTPYLWLGGVHSDYSKAASAGSPQLTGQTDIGNILPHLSTFPVMGAGEVRYGRFGLLVDVVALSASFPSHLHRPIPLPGTAQVSEVQTGFALSYRVLQTDQQFADLGVGGRGWIINTKLQFGPTSLSNHSRWIDPVIVARYHLNLPANFGITLLGDIGGLGGAKLVYQVVGTVDYRATQWMVLHAGYRYSYFDYHGTPVRFNATLNGPLVGATFRF